MNAEQFLHDYASALNSFDASKVARFYLPPAIVMNDHGKQILATSKEINETFTHTLEQLRQSGIAKMVPTLQQNMLMSETLSFSKMTWELFDSADQLLFGCASSHTLQMLPNGEMRIIVIVVEDTEDALAKIFPI